MRVPIWVITLVFVAGVALAAPPSPELPVRAPRPEQPTLSDDWSLEELVLSAEEEEAAAEFVIAGKRGLLCHRGRLEPRDRTAPRRYTLSLARKSPPVQRRGRLKNGGGEASPPHGPPALGNEPQRARGGIMRLLSAPEPHA